MTAYYTGYFKMQNYEKSAIKRLTAPAYLFLSIDFGLVRALYMPDKLNRCIYSWAKEIVVDLCVHKQVIGCDLRMDAVH